MDKKELNKYIEVLNKMYEAQKELNSLLFPEWMYKLSLQDYYTDIFFECGEAIDSLDWKWWKKQENDFDNLKVELIDILHFMFSASYFAGKDFRDEAFVYFIEAMTSKREAKNIKSNLVQIPCRDITIGFSLLGELFNSVGVSFEDLAREYFIKYTLNKFRTLNGYKEGTYQKVIKGKEDNVWIWQLAEDLKVDKYFRDKLYKRFEKFYSENKQKGLFDE